MNNDMTDCGLTKEQLVFWFKCLRKHSFETKALADIVIAEHNDENRLQSYQCEYCNRWHTGQINSRANTPLSKIRSNWKNRDVRPTVEIVIESFNNPVESTKVFWQHK